MILEDIARRNLLLVIEIYTICIVSLTLAIGLSKRLFSKSTENIRLKRFTFSVIASIVFDLACYLLDLHANPNLRWLNLICNMFYISISAFVSWFGFDFLTYKFKSWVIYAKNVRLYLFIPILFYVALTIISGFTGWMYSVNENGVYERGPLFILQMLPWLYQFSLIVSAFVKFCDKKNIGYEKMFLSSTFFCAIPVFCEIMQLLGAGLPSLSIGYAIANIFIYIILLEDNITVDTLTKLSNHLTFIKTLTNRAKIMRDDDRVYLLMIDLNDFKELNEEYGRTEGDNALITVTDAITDLAKDYGIYAGRFDGDTFAMIVDRVNEVECRNLTKSITNQIEDIKREKGYKWNISFSFGYTKLIVGDDKDISKSIERATDMLNLNKTLYKEMKKNSK